MFLAFLVILYLIKFLGPTRSYSIPNSIKIYLGCLHIYTDNFYLRSFGNLIIFNFFHLRTDRPTNKPELKTQTKFAANGNDYV